MKINEGINKCYGNDNPFYTWEDAARTGYLEKWRQMRDTGPGFEVTKADLEANQRYLEERRLAAVGRNRQRAMKYYEDIQKKI